MSLGINYLINFIFITMRRNIAFVLLSATKYTQRERNHIKATIFVIKNIPHYLSGSKYARVIKYKISLNKFDLHFYFLYFKILLSLF